MNESQSSPKRKHAEPLDARIAAGRTASKIGASQHRVRACLSCGERFPSAGNHERICGPCKERDAWLYGAAVTKGHTAW